MDKHPSEQNLREFMISVSKLEPIEFMGLTKILNIELYEDEEKKKPRNFETVLSEVLDKYISLPRRRRRTVLKILKSANLSKVEA